MYSSYTKQQVTHLVGIYGKDIITAITDTGLFFPAFVGQVYVESRGKTGDGLSKLATDYNNFGGLKVPAPFSIGTVDSLSGEGSRTKGTYDKELGSFAVFATPADSFRSHVAILQHDLYVRNGVFDAQTPEEQILAIARAGYTTADPQEYLYLIQGSLDCARDIYKLGKIVSNVPAQSDVSNNGQVAGGNLLDQITASTQQTLADAMKLFGGNK